MKYTISYSSVKNHKWKIALLIIASIAIVVSCGIALLSRDKSLAYSGFEFNPGRIIDDAVFYNAQSMTPDQIQVFLNSKVPTCDTNGTGKATEWGSNLSRAAYAASRGWDSPPYTCLKDFRQDTPQMEAASGLCGAIPSASRSAAQIIHTVAQACGINSQVLIVLLEKEQSLVTDIWPLPRQYRNATGFACPDTAPCNPAYNGFFYQVYHAARQFKVYQAYPNNYNYIAGRTNRIYWQTNLGNFINTTGNVNDPSRAGQSACGYNNVYIENQATAALYVYTPYQPNQSALNNLRGTGDGCSAYGNRNFWRLFKDWFGSTYSNDTTNPHPDGTVVSLNNKAYLVQSSSLHHITSGAVFESHGYRWQDVKPATTGDKNLPITWSLNFIRPGVLYASGNSSVYMTVDHNGEWVKQVMSYASFVALGYNWSSVKSVMSNELPVKTSPTTYDTTTRHPDGTLIQDNGSVYLIDYSSKRYVSAKAFESQRWNWSDIVTATIGDKNLTPGASVLLKEGTVVYTGSDLYIVKLPAQGSEILLPIAPWYCFADVYKYSLSQTVSIPTRSLPVARGALVTC